MGGKSKAPKYQSATYDSDLWGSSTTDKSGTVYTPENWMNKTMGTVGKNLNPTLKSMVNNDFMTDKNFLRYQDRFNDQMNDLYDTSVLSNLAGRGLMRSSGLQGATDAFTDNLRRGQLDLYDNYYNRLNNNLANMLNTSNTLYNYMQGVNAGAMNNANAINNYNLQKWQAEQQAAAQQQALYGQIAKAAGSVAGGVAGGPIGSVAAGALAKKLGQSMPSA